MIKICQEWVDRNPCLQKVETKNTNKDGLGEIWIVCNGLIKESYCMPWNLTKFECH